MVADYKRQQKAYNKQLERYKGLMEKFLAKQSGEKEHAKLAKV